MGEEEEVIIKAEDVQGNEDVTEEAEVSQEEEGAKGGCCGGCT
jgi:hypothetical protein